MSASPRIACLLLPSSFDPEQLPAVGEACFRFSPQIALREGEGVFIEIGKSRNLYTEESLLARLLALAGRFAREGQWSRVAIADSVPAALALARHHGRKIAQGPEPVRALPVKALRDFLSPFGSDPDALREADRVAHVLHVLGIETLGGFLDLPRATLASRLGKDALALHARVSGELSISWKGFHPLPRVVEKALVEEGGESIEALGFIFKGALDRAMARLRGRAERASILQLVLDLERWSTSELRREWQIEFPLPQGSSAGALPLILERLRFELEREPLTSPAQSISIEVLETAPGRGAQNDFFDKREEQDEEMESLFARLVQKLGKQNAFVVRPVSRHLPEGAFGRAKPGMEPALESAPIPERPLRVLRKPELLEIRGPFIKKISSSTGWYATRWVGPERISGEWWKESAFARDYFRVETEAGQHLWIYSECQSKRFFLHGFFD